MLNGRALQPRCVAAFGPGAGCEAHASAPRQIAESPPPGPARRSARAERRGAVQPASSSAAVGRRRPASRRRGRRRAWRTWRQEALMMDATTRTILLGTLAALLSAASARAPAGTPAPAAEAPASSRGLCCRRPSARQRRASRLSPRPRVPMMTRHCSASSAVRGNVWCAPGIGMDQAARQSFSTSSRGRRRSCALRPAPNRATLQIGNDGWPLPIPMLQRGGAWRFDAAAGAQEIVDRRIGRNELDTIETLHAIADAQDEYARTAGRQGGLRGYARRFFSTPGQRDGLSGRRPRERQKVRSVRSPRQRAQVDMAGASAARDRSPITAMSSACWNGRGLQRRAGRLIT